jgi:hypothetical protein
MIRDVVFHGHHQSGAPIELLYESFEQRKTAILMNKPEYEKKRRLALFKKVKFSDLPLKIRKDVKQIVDIEKKQNKEYTSGRYCQSMRYRSVVERWFQSDAGLRFHHRYCKCGWTRRCNNIFSYSAPVKAKRK